MSEKRRDHRGRILHNGEIQLSDGRYRFKYVDEMGKERCVYSWRLDHNDATPKGKRRTLSLREMEKKIQADHFEQIATNGGNMTVLKLVEKYTSTKTGVRPTTVAGYGTVLNLLKKDPFGKRRIDMVRISDAKCWLIHLQQFEKRSYSSIHSIRGVLRPAFQLAVDDNLIRKNSFQFQLMEVIVNDSVTREAISRAEECFRKIVEKRNPPKAEPMVDGKAGFLYFDKNGSICYSLHWEHCFKHIVQKYNNIYKVQIPNITPHVCRHTYCSNMAKSGMNPKTLQYLMGYSDISVTLNTYTHVNLEDAREEVARLRIV